VTIERKLKSSELEKYPKVKVKCSQTKVFRIRKISQTKSELVSQVQLEN